MPILEVEIVTGPEGLPDEGLAQRLADAAGEVLGTPPGRTWVRLRELPQTHYAENQVSLEDGVRPVFVTLLKALPGEDAERRHEARELCRALARVCRRSAENVHLLFLPPAAGRIAFGGELLDG